MYKTVTWVYGSRVVNEFEDKESAMDFGEWGSDYGEHFFECVLDENDIIIYDGKESVIGIDDDSRVGGKYIFD